jgi:drug/metabolite transporter (DMT)-like permease
VSGKVEANTATLTPARAPGIGLLYALLGFSTLSFGDALVKSMAGDWPATAVATLRYLYATLFLGGLILVRVGPSGFAVGRYDLQFGRGAAISVASVCFYLAVQAMPLAAATSIQFTSPIWVALLSPWLLKERASPAAIFCTLLALCGVGIVLRPNLLELGPAALLPVFAALGMATLVIFNRKSQATAPSVLAMQFWVAAAATPILFVTAVIGHLSGWDAFHIEAPRAIVLLKTAGVATTGTLAHWLIYVATERASAPLVAPMVYIQLLMAGALGWFLFGNGIDLVSGIGMAVIIVAGLLLWRSQRNPEVPLPPD